MSPSSSGRLKPLAGARPRRYLTAAQVAELVFDISVGRFYHKLAALRRRGFPKPVSGCGYDPAAITAWQDMEIIGCFATGADTRTDNIALLDDAALERAALERL